MHLTRSASRGGKHLVRLATVVLASISVLLASCGGGGYTSPPPSPPTYTAKSGVAQKGPLIKGSTVTAQELNASLSPTGKQYTYQTTSDLGTFSPTSTFSSQYIGVIASGYYFDEVVNAVSSGTVTLNSYSDLAVESVLNVNLLTTLEYQRIQNLVTQSNMTFAAARAQAESEVLKALNIPSGSYGAFDTLDVSGSSDGDHILEAISSIFVYGNSAGSLSQLIANFQSDIGANGVITNPKTTAALVAAAQAINPATIAANLSHEYASEALTFTASGISDWIAQSSDGVVGKFQFQVPDATPSSPFTFPAFVVNSVIGASVSVIGGQLWVNGTLVTGAVTVMANDVLAVSPGVGDFPNGVLTIYLASGTTKIARVSFVSGLVSIAVTPNAPNVPLGLTQQFKATGTFSDTSTADLTNSVTWISGTPVIATVNATSGLVSSVGVGSTIVTATSGSVSGNTTLTVTPVALESIAVATASAGVTNTAQLTATGSYSDGSTANLTTAATWLSSDPTLATVGASTGVATGVALGSVTVTATVGTVAGTAMLTIIPTTWHQAASMATGRGSFTLTSLSNGLALAAGGGTNTGNGVLASAELYDPVANRWSAAGSLAIAREGHTANALQSGLVLVTGGGGGPGVEVNLDSCELYNPATNSWSAAGNLNSTRVEHTATLLANGQVLVVGGESLISAELYDPVANTWSVAANLAVAPIMFHTATLLTNGKVLVAGGYNGTVDLSSAELYDPVANTWTAAANLITARAQHSATLLPNGTVLVAGGSSNGSAPYTYSQLTSAEIYDPVANTWSSAASLVNHSGGGFIATLLPNGKVLVAGPGTSGSAELYDPTTDTWSATTNLITSRYNFAATLLQSGEVMVAGGDPVIPNDTNAPLTSAELYP